MGRQFLPQRTVASSARSPDTSMTGNTFQHLSKHLDDAPDPEALSRLMYPDNANLRRKVIDFMQQPLFTRRYDITVAQHRTLTNQRLSRLIQAGFFAATLTGSSSSASRQYNTVVEAISLIDHSLEVKVGVNFGLFGGTVRALGNDEQIAYWMPRIESNKEFGCFALTELGHGSNVRGIETTAIYDKETGEFIINTPTETSQKYWIGGAAESASVTVVFAKLTVDGIDRGIHVFIVRLRDTHGKVIDGITIADCGPKIGLNGVDNGRLWFSNHRIPRSAMLTKLSQVTNEGEFKASIESSDGRFAAVLAALTGGRITIASVAIKSAMLGLTIAIRYSKSRKAFAPAKGSPELPILFYTSQKRRLIIPLASCFVYYFCARDLVEEWALVSGDGKPLSKAMHLESAGYKALFTWFMQDALQAARESCGGQGYKSDNEIAHLKADRDVMLTFEGANGVILQQVGKQLLSEVAMAAELGGKFPKSSPLFSLNEEPQAGTEDDVRMVNRRFVKRVLWRREKGLVTELWNSYRAAMKRHNAKSFYAWNDCLAVAESAAIAHMHRRIFDNSAAHIRLAEEVGGNCANSLTLCGRLWAASLICKDVDFLRLGCLTRDEATTVSGVVNGLCEDVTGIVDELLKGIDYPDHILAPIARDWVKHNSRAML